MMIPEDGTGRPGANSYASLTQANDYHSARMNAEWIAADTRAQEAALIRATDYIEAHYDVGGLPFTLGQGLQAPTLDAVAVPSAIVAATLMLALYALHGPLSAPASRGISKSTQKLEGVGELTTEYDPAMSGDPYPAITRLLATVAKVRGEATQASGGLIMAQMIR